jgi:alpha-N-acetylgalactosaminidase
MKPNYTAIKEHCNLWRNFYDVQDNWHNIQGIIDHYGDNTDGFLEVAGPGAWNDPDMIVVGNFGLSYDQSAAQLALWTVFASPLILSVDLRTIRPEFRQLLQHPGVLKVAQDPLGVSGRRVARREHVDFFTRPVHPVWGNGTSHAVVIFNRHVR